MNSPSKSPEKIDFSQVLTDHFIDLTKSEKRIANFLRKNQEESAFLSAGEIASRSFCAQPGFLQLSGYAHSLTGQLPPARHPLRPSARQA